MSIVTEAWKRFALALAVLGTCGVGPDAQAAGSGAGAGGSGHQRAINSGLPPGEPGPPGAPNNPHKASEPPRPISGTPHPKAARPGQ